MAPAAANVLSASISIKLLVVKVPTLKVNIELKTATVIEEYNISFLCCIFLNNVPPKTTFKIARIIILGLNPTAPPIKITFNILNTKDIL